MIEFIFSLEMLDTLCLLVILAALVGWIHG